MPRMGICQTQWARIRPSSNESSKLLKDPALLEIMIAGVAQLRCKLGIEKMRVSMGHRALSCSRDSEISI